MTSSTNNNSNRNDNRQGPTSRRPSGSDVLQRDPRHPQMAVRRASTFTTTSLSSWSESTPGTMDLRRFSAAGSLPSMSRRGSAASNISMSSLGDSSFLLLDDLLADIVSPRMGRRDSLLNIIGTAIDVVEDSEEQHQPLEVEERTDELMEH